MPAKLPSSRASFCVRLWPFDVVWAALAPLLALYLRDAPVLSVEGANIAFLYCSLSFVFTLIAFSAFRVSDALPRYFSLDDFFRIAKAIVVACLTTSIFLFTLTRLNGIPRTTPVLQVLVLAAGVFAARVVMLLSDKDDQLAGSPVDAAVEHIIMIGSTKLSSLYIKLIRTYSPAHRHVIAVLDAEQKLIGRAMSGVPVVASPQYLDQVIEEFAVHGVHTDRIIVGGDDHFLSAQSLDHIRSICRRRELALDFVPELIGLKFLHSTSHTPSLEPAQAPHSTAPLPAYFRVKRFIDFAVALAALLMLAPLFITVSLLILFDMGLPVLFWQKRVGNAGRSVLVYKFRTLRPPFDHRGHPLREEQRLSWIGRTLRGSRTDELPQLFNVLIGEMSLIGPRPLLPCDQPMNANGRLRVRPGITGWAQINGANLVTPEEKGALDDWYIENASLWLDLRIILLTLRFLVTGERRSEQAVSEAGLLQHANGESENLIYAAFGAPEPSGQSAVGLKLASSRARHSNLD